MSNKPNRARRKSSLSVIVSNKPTDGVGMGMGSILLYIHCTPRNKLVGRPLGGSTDDGCEPVPEGKGPVDTVIDLKQLTHFGPADGCQ